MTKCDCCGKMMSDFGGHALSYKEIGVEEAAMQSLCEATSDGWITLCLGCEWDFYEHRRKAAMEWLRKMKVVKEEGNDA